MFDINAINVLFVKPEITKITDTKIDLHTKLPNFRTAKYEGSTWELLVDETE